MSSLDCKGLQNHYNFKKQYNMMKSSNMIVYLAICLLWELVLFFSLGKLFFLLPYIILYCNLSFEYNISQQVFFLE